MVIFYATKLEDVQISCKIQIKLQTKHKNNNKKSRVLNVPVETNTQKKVTKTM